MLRHASISRHRSTFAADPFVANARRPLGVLFIVPPHVLPFPIQPIGAHRNHFIHDGWEAIRGLSAVHVVLTVDTADTTIVKLHQAFSRVILTEI